MCLALVADVLSLPVGMAFMRKRQPLKLKRFAALHNAFLFSLSLYMSVECIRQSYRTFRWGRKFQLWCNPNDSGLTFSPDGYRLARVLWIHYLSKVRAPDQDPPLCVMTAEPAVADYDARPPRRHTSLWTLTS